MNSPTSTGQPQAAGTMERFLLLAVLLAYAVLAVLYAVKTPPWQVPDEPAHYNYIRQVAESGCCPVLEAPDWDLDYLSRLTGSGFDPQYLADLPAVQYEDHQPPLFYLLAAPVFSLSGGSLTALRLASALLGAGVILAVYGIARAASGGNVPLALGAAAFTAFLPQHIAVMAGAGNDSLAELIVGVGVLLALWHLTPETPRRIRPGPVMMGLVMGLGLLTKASTLLLGPVIVLALFLRWRRKSDRRWTALLRAWGFFLVPALLLGALWWGRNLSLYGWPDLMGLGRHDAVVIGQPRTADWIAREGFGAWLGEGVRITFQSFWGQFGWMGVPMPGAVYLALLAFALVSHAGLIPLALRRHPDQDRGLKPPVQTPAQPPARPPVQYPGGPPVRFSIRSLAAAQRDSLLVLGTLFLLGIAQFVYYNTSFVQFQGRYLYPALAAIAAVYAAGWVGWADLLSAQSRRAWLRWLPLAIMGGLAGLSAYALWRFVLPNLPAWP